ncbi:hypothetical protein GOODEAATRI_023488 [Goodea atripinnis]|uniref:Uncharacterized protein n=1 Tax=Goodea atripinnis TaxID=208336 RepID=A0ABV0NCY4_9TELE
MPAFMSPALSKSSLCVRAVKTRVGQLKEKLNQLLKDVDNSYNMALIKMPIAVRQTVWLQHCSVLTVCVFSSNRKPLLTPARNLLDSSLMMGSTPLITPRFDPRLPKTPAVRLPCHKERVYSISVNGSPIAAGSEDIIINVPVGNGEVSLQWAGLCASALGVSADRFLNKPDLCPCRASSCWLVRWTLWT